MKKAPVIFFCNLLLLILLIILLEFYYVYKWNNITGNVKNSYTDILFHSLSVDQYFDSLYKNEPLSGVFLEEFRPDENIHSNKKPVLFMGCSFTWGPWLENNETVSAQFAKLTGRPVYNRGGNGWGLSHFLYQLKRSDFYEQFKDEPEYLFYIYIFDHNNRLDKFKVEPCCIEFQPKYKEINGHLVEQKPKIWDRLYFIENFQYRYNFIKKNAYTSLLKLYFKEAKEEMRKHWKKTKPVILVYPLGFGYVDESVWKDLTKNGYEVIFLDNLVDIDLTDKKYKTPDNWHPAKEAWQEILPELIKKLDIQ